MSDYILNQYSRLVHFLGKTLGPDYEVILHDLRPEKGCITAIENGHVSGRTPGAPLTDLALKMIADKSYKNADYVLNYTGKAENGKKLRSSTMFIKDETENLIGIICIKFDTSKFNELKFNLRELFESYMIPADLSEYTENEESDVIENFSSSIETVVNKSISSELVKCNIPVERLTNEEKLDIVEDLGKKGVFLLKGAVNEVAKQLKCSEASIYRYLSKINNSEK